MHETGDAMIGGGGGGSAEAGSISMKVGGTTTGRSHELLFGVGLTGDIYGGDVSENTLDYPVPHYNYTDRGNQSIGQEYG